MNILLKIIFIILVTSNLVFGQSQIKEKVVLSYIIGEQDSTILFRKTMQYDNTGRLIQKQNYYYHRREKGQLIKEEKAFFNTSNQVLTEEIIDYPEGKDPLRQKLITQYLDYQAKEKDSKYILRQLFDKYGEIAKEDTLTYDNDQNPIELCSYNYTGSTSLSCNYYTYKNNLQTRWTTYAKWNTINAKGKVVDRSGKRRDYRYWYNKDGKLTRTCGKYYKNKFRQKITYDTQGRLKENKSILKRKIKQLGTKEAPAKKKYKLKKEEQIISYEDGHIVSDVKLINKKEIKRKDFTYENGVVISIQRSVNGHLLEEIIYRYNKSMKVLEKNSTRYTKNKKVHYRTSSFYDENENIIREEQNMGGKTLTVKNFVYDDKGNPVEQSLSTQNNKSLEKTLYIYKYY